ncbi:MAG TPA: hypothetical protein VGP33_08270 [Chloroflexota bacterium]|nr:hypothetical protein [Chloroflexota bacterium]
MLDDDGGDLADAQPVPEQTRRVKSSSLLWFISSRPYVPMADIRRRFGLQTETGTFLFDEEGSVHIGLPRQAAETLLDLKRKQKVDFQYDLEYATRIAVGAYPIRIRLSPPVAGGRAFQPFAPAEALNIRVREEEEETPDAGPPVEPPVLPGASPAQPRRRRRRR